MLREVDAVLGQYAARSGHLLQRFVVAHKGFVAIPKPQAAPRKALLFVGALISALLPALASLWLPFGVRSFFPIPALVAQVMPVLLPLLLLVAPPLAARRHSEEQTGAMAHRWIRRLTARAPRFVPPRNVLLPFAPWWRPAILSSGELGGVFHLPSPIRAIWCAGCPIATCPRPRMPSSLSARDRRSWAI